jgi:4-hydroxy-3-methylbut-2-enyl diphosphate reductase IspH
LPGAVITVTPQHGTPSTFTVNTSTIVRERDMASPVLANGERVIVSAATSAPGAVATTIRIIPAPPVVVQGLLSGLPGAVITVTPQHGTPSTFTVNTSTIVRERDMSTPVLANGERVIVSAATSAPGAVATAIRIIPAPKGM